ncbi:MAG: hypothetical protein ABL999_09415 [Pyrinomonadaceae bacterium]
MKHVKLTVLFLGLGFVFAACGTQGDIAINIEKKSSSMNATYGVIRAADEDTYRGRKTIFYSFWLSNFDLGIEKEEKAGLGPTLSSADQKKIFFNIIVGEDGSFGTKLREGVYSSPRATHVTPGLEMGSFRVFTFSNGEENQWERLGGTEQSFVNIISVKDDTVTGEITFIDGDDSAKGKFTAKMIKKKEE